MVVDAVRTYLDAANGLTELSRKQAVAAAKALLRANGPAAPAAGESEGLPPRVGQSIQTLAGELLETSQSNRTAITDLVRSEVERQLERMDVVPRAEHERLVRRVAELERRLAARHAVERALVTTAGDSSSVRPASAGAPADGSAEAGGAAEPAEAEDGSEEATGTEEAAGDGGTHGQDTPSASSTEPEAADEADDTGQKGGADSGTGPEGAAAGTTAENRSHTAVKGPAKNARTRSNAKRTTKGKGATKK